MRELTYRPAALDDLDGIYDYIEPENPRRAFSFVEDIRKRCRTLCEHPELGPARSDIKPGLRIYPMFGRIVVFYRITESAIVIVRVFSGGMDYETLMRDEPLE
ncbi:type II toxin-antitoxin system RelE/ParE family toxin [Ancylobacter sp. 6x-1]|uniref:Type II toxin-antitoxin system RelE/ParE family toxin n=1 Tax=Ancylobacter crimeensis TaxID=2579147 RepID=A0ABT0DBX1_9HYPH|nr:type II toxin-antitoxin system RelE/ParE family toxin [Ancylobacter crimeensis]MCK0197374.1 type II toxin-antitoxin system RelE/ParE family toxin [Ancylobacter crimeensis]